jgi:hypothetical protein
MLGVLIADQYSRCRFSQRYTGTVSDDGTTIVGAWEQDFDLSYTKT